MLHAPVIKEVLAKIAWVKESLAVMAAVDALVMIQALAQKSKPSSFEPSTREHAMAW